MAAIPCDACGGKMNSDLAVCPHCGARRAVAAAPKWSGDEIRALLATDATARRTGESRGMFQTLVLPHPGATGGGRAAEIALTLLSLPLVVSGALSVMLLFRRRARAMETTGELVPAVSMTVFGLGGLIGQLPAVLVGASVVALWLRAVLRARLNGMLGRDLHRIERPARDRSPALPVAQALPAAPPPPKSAPSPLPAASPPPKPASSPLPAASPPPKSAPSPLAASPPVPTSFVPPAPATPQAPDAPLEPGVEPRLLR